jgi:CBS domain-containing membrane protein
MLVRDVMSTNTVSVVPETPLKLLWRVFTKERINAIPVVDKKQHLVGIITKEDLLAKLYPDYEEFMSDIESFVNLESMEVKIKEIGSRLTSEVMCKRVIYTRLDTPVMRALSRMIVRRVNQIPVLSHEDKVVGMITKGDIFYALFQTHLKDKESKEQPKEKKSPKKK